VLTESTYDINNHYYWRGDIIQLYHSYQSDDEMIVDDKCPCWNDHDDDGYIMYLWFNLMMFTCYSDNNINAAMIYF